MCENRITIATIAEILDVSPITVSRALSGQPGVGEELRERVLSKARELGYKKIKSIDKISVLLLVRQRFINDNSNFSYMVQGIEKYIKQYGVEFTMEFIEKEKQDSFILPYNLSRGSQFDGVIMLGWFEDSYVSFIKQKLKNMVVFNQYSYEVDCDYIYFNYNRTGYKAAEYLIKRGHSRIGFIGVEGMYNNPQRFLGFQKALEHHHVELNPDYLINNRSEMEERIRALIDSGNLPTAFICESDNTALKLVKLLYDNRIFVPENVSVMGIGDTEMSAISIPALTTFDLNIEYACEAAVRLLLNRMNDKTGPCRTIYIDTTLVERQSVRNLVPID